MAVALAAWIILTAVSLSAATIAAGGPIGLSEPTESAPALVPVSATANPARPQEGEVVHVSVTVENRGTVAAESATINLFDRRPNGDSVRIGPTALPASLAPGTSIAVPMQPFLAVGVGDHTLTITVGDVMPPGAAESRMMIPMTVAPAKTPPPPPSDGVAAQGFGTPELAVVLVVLGTAILVGSAIALLRRPEPDRWSLDPPEAEPVDRSPPPIWPL